MASHPLNLIDSIVKAQGEIAAIRRDLHAHPELGYEEERTSGIVAKLLEGWGVEVHRNIGVTGVVGVIRGRGDSGRAIGLRADMDALPMQELNTFAHASKNQGKMHACGHDGHTAMLLAGARYLAETRDFDGTVYAIFQPAEEGLVGAKKMIDDGLFSRFPMEAVFGMHNMPSLEVGHFGVLDGPVMASSNYFHLIVKGRGSHAAQPHRSHDPIAAVVQVAQAFQTVVTRNIDPLDPVVLSITQIHGGSANNVVPDTAELKGTLRTFSEAVRDLAHARLRALATKICEAMDCEAEFNFWCNYPPTINHPRETAISAAVLADMVGADAVERKLRPSMGGEDFALMLKERPGCYVWIGNGAGLHRAAGHGPGPSTLHNGSYDFNDALIPIGGSYWAHLARGYFTRSQS